jgi:homogentisate 1,2-dioxygenase
VKVRVRGGYQTYVLDYHPLDVVGWDGYLYPWTFSVHDFEPITGRIHQPPPSHQTFQGQNFVICSFSRGSWTSTRWRFRFATSTRT